MVFELVPDAEAYVLVERWTESNGTVVQSNREVLHEGPIEGKTKIVLEEGLDQWIRLELRGRLDGGPLGRTGAQFDLHAEGMMTTVRGNATFGSVEYCSITC